MSQVKQIRVYRLGAENGWSDRPSEIHQAWRKWKRMLIVESGHGKSQKRMETCIQYSFAARLYGLQAEGSTGSCKATAGSLNFSFIVGCLAGNTKSHDIKSHDRAFSSPSLMQRLGALQDQITG